MGRRVKGCCACPRQEPNRVLTGSGVLTLALIERRNSPKCNNVDTPLSLVVTVLTLRFQEMVNGKVPDLLSDPLATHTGGTPVDATQHASFSHPFSDFIKCSKGFYYARRGCAFQFYDDSRARSEHVFQYLFRRSRISCVPGDKGLEEVAYRLADGGGESGERFAARHQHPAERREQSFSKQRRPAQTRIVATTHREKFQDFRGRSRTGTIHLHVETFSQRETAP